MKGRIEALTATFEGKPRLTLDIDDTLEHIGIFAEEFKNKVLDIEIKQYKQKRSLSANAYFHVLVTNIAKKLGTSNQYIKNKLLHDYGQFQYINDDVVLLMTQDGVELEEQEGIHAWLEDFYETNGTAGKVYALMRGSHTYNTEEMARLIDGTIKEAEALGIPTLTPAEIARLS